ncbi:ATP-binding protein [Verrucosispora sp. WMMC514]|uniref:AlbA family DNA-binding domain-containing protein n=1 Tax=Verrucosispora sp. WMMC514 TaxID=3015156 RepID=UPI00248CA98C|nr:ATP-binding protein [Verrucosispora sp. WMMC514]WBB91500.1 ATP-binding protein [Verrucosispora sp. WMMC514]
MESGMTPVDDLTGMIEQSNAVDVRLALYREKDAWRIGYGEVLIGADHPARERTWTYGEDAFVERRLPGSLAADLVRGISQHVAELTVSAPAVHDSGSFQRVAGQVHYNNAVLPWPRTEWQLSPTAQAPTRPRRVLVGDGPSFLNTEAAFNAFFYTATVENGPRPTHMLWRIVRADRRGWLHRVVVAPDALTVHVKGTELAGTQVELATPDDRQIRPVGMTGRLRFRLPRGLAPATIVMLRTGHDWLDFRYFPAPGPGGDPDSSVIWDLPGADASVLIAGGESQYVEFKEQLPVNDHRRKMLKTVAAFASGDGGTVLIGVTDDSQIVGVDATKLDELMLTLHNMIRSNIDPDPGATVRPVAVDGKTVLLVEVPARSGWHAYNREKPEFYLRRGANTVPARLTEITSRFVQQQTLPW